MKNRTKLFLVFLSVIVAFLFSYNEPAIAYIDPFVGQTLFRILFPFIVGLGGVLIVIRRQIASLLWLMKAQLVKLTGKALSGKSNPK